MSAVPGDTVLYGVQDGVATVTLNRPQKLNVVSVEMQRDVDAALAEAEADTSVRVIVLTGRGKAFIAGADITTMATLTPLAFRQYAIWFRRLRQTIYGLSKPVIAAVNGYAYGGGALVAWSADLVIASDGARFGQQEANLGHFAGASFLPRLVGRLRAAELVLLGKSISAHEAERMGLVNRVVAAEALDAAVRETCEELKRKSPTALAFAKQALRIQAEAGEAVAEQYELELEALCYSTWELKESMQAFLERRTPDFTARVNEEIRS
jgi:enoyl-CoA hydratase/carnithine racemase